MSLESPNNPESKLEAKIFTDVRFVEKKDKRGVVVDYENSAPGRKRIRLLKGVVPDLKKKYNVKIVGDSAPEDVLSGYYTAELYEEKLPDWKESEFKISDIENTDRQLHKSRVVLHNETGLTDMERENMEESGVLHKSKRPRVTQKALENEKIAEKEIEEALGADDSFERKFLSFARLNLVKALKEDRNIELGIKSLRKEEDEILRSISGEPSGSELEALDEIKEEISKLESRRDQLVLSSPEAYYGLHLKELKGYKEDLETGKIVETPYVQEKIEDVVSHIRAGKPVMIYGHLGSGKTELALHTARNYILRDRPDIDESEARDFNSWLDSNPNATEEDKKKKLEQISASHRSALVISGSKNMSTSELYGHQVLDIEKIKKEELDQFVKDVEEKYETWQKENEEKLKGLSGEEAEQEKNRAHDRLLQTYLTQFKGGTISDYFLGPIYRAMDEGRPVIIDEVNAIPHEILISLNHVLTRRVGDEINVQQNSGSAITIKEGYGVITTGNLNQGDNRYVDRQDMDPAFLSRFYKIEYDYLPQKKEGSLEYEAGKGNELFHLLLARIMDKNGNVEVPEEAVDKLWNLAKASRVIQDVFSGKETNQAYYFKTGGSRGIKYVLKESVLSLRGLDKIITQWQKEGYKYEIDYYIWNEFVSQSTNATDKAYIYQLLKDQFGFFIGGGWEKNPNYGSGGAISSFDIKAPKNPSEKIKFHGPREVVDFAYGKGPKRTNWPGEKKS